MKDDGVEIPRSRAWVERSDETDPVRHDGPRGADGGFPAQSSLPSEPNYRWRNAMAEWRLNEALAHLDDAVAADPSRPARQAIADARMHLIRAQSYLRAD
jgi:hypothetical protein